MTIDGPVVIGNGVVVEHGAHIRRSILWDRCDIGAGATICDAIIGTTDAVAANATLDGVVVGEEPYITSRLVDPSHHAVTVS